MISAFHQLRRHEEGQTLVLAALFGLILALCVLGTVNVGRAVYDKVQLQTACDNGAYSQAAVEARVLNFTAYTNRAMVVHYASIMATSAYLTWLHFMYVFVHGMLTLIKIIPYVGAVANVVQQVFQGVMKAIDVLVSVMTPLVAAANVVLYALQEGAWWSVYFGRLAGMPPEAHSGDSGAAEFKPIWPTLIPAANMALFAQSRGHLTVPSGTLETAKILLNGSSDEVQEARLHMVEVANSARTPWVAYGDRYTDPVIWPTARHNGLRIPICNLRLGSVARTELGTKKPAGLLGALDTFGQVFSGDLAQITYNCRILIFPVSGRVTLFGLTTIDDLFAGVSKKRPASNFIGVGSTGGLVAKLLAQILSGFNSLVAYAKAQAPVSPDYRAFWISPYVYFAPRAAAKPGGGLTRPLGNFAQPDVILGVAREGSDYNQDVGAQQLYGGRHSINLGGGVGTVDFRYGNGDWPKPAGLPLLHKGFNAFCAAQVYYHRPGEWREMPNFFNPLWGARLMPVVESNAAAALGIDKVPLIKQYLLH